MALTVAVTGPTGQIGTAAVTALEREPAVERIHGMARRPFDPASMGWLKTTYRQGDILDRGPDSRKVMDLLMGRNLEMIVNVLRVCTVMY